jgi:hypothetical protein
VLGVPAPSSGLAAALEGAATPPVALLAAAELGWAALAAPSSALLCGLG